MKLYTAIGTRDLEYIKNKIANNVMFLDIYDFRRMKNFNSIMIKDISRLYRHKFIQLLNTEIFNIAGHIIGMLLYVTTKCCQTAVSLNQ